MTEPEQEKVRYDGVGRSQGNMGYDVWLGERLIGRVRPYEKRYNLRRMVVDKGWTSYALDGTEVRRAERRRDAVEALLRHLDLPPTATR